MSQIRQILKRFKIGVARLPDWQVFADRAKKFIISISSIAGGVIFIGFLKNSIFTSSVEIEPIKIPDGFAQKGYTSERRGAGFSDRVLEGD